MQPRALVIVGPGFEDVEYVYPYYRLQEAGMRVDVCCSNDQAVAGKHGIVASPDVRVGELAATDYRVAVIAGGHEGPDRVRQVPEILEFLRRMDADARVIASICHGPWVLISAGIMRGRRATCYKGCRDDLMNAGAIVLDESVVVDRNLVTAPHFRDCAAWMKAVLAVVEK